MSQSYQVKCGYAQPRQYSEDVSIPVLYIWKTGYRVSEAYAREITAET